jgi:hypothetical protein
MGIQSNTINSNDWTLPIFGNHSCKWKGDCLECLFAFQALVIMFGWEPEYRK